MLCTRSSLRAVMPQIETVLKLRVPIVSTTEELAYPYHTNRPLARKIDALATKAKVAVVGTGVNPGFVMDALPIMLTGVCERVDADPYRPDPGCQRAAAPLPAEDRGRPHGRAVQGTGGCRHRSARRSDGVHSHDRRRVGLEDEQDHRHDRAQGGRDSRWRATI